MNTDPYVKEDDDRCPKCANKEHTKKEHRREYMRAYMHKYTEGKVAYRRWEFVPK